MFLHAYIGNQSNMANILIGLVIAMFIGTAVYVGYVYSENYEDDYGYEDGANLNGVCAGGLYGNDRILIPESTDMILIA